METHLTDSIISEVRAVRDAHAARFDYDVAAIFRDIRAMQEKSGLNYVRHPGRPVAASNRRNSSSDDGIDAPVADSDL